MTKKIILLHVILGILGGFIFLWTTRFKGVDIFYLIDYLVIFIILSIVSIVLWKNNLFISYCISILVILYFFYLIFDVVDESYWLYYIFLLLPMGVIFLAVFGAIEKLLRKIS